MCNIAWCGFTWEAFATLMTGVLAVGAAVYVGRRQTKIMDEQTAIAKRQVDLEHLKLRADLFDRRMAVFETTDRWLGEFWAHGKPATGDIERDFICATDTAKLLFRPAVAEQMRKWYLMGVDHHAYDVMHEVEKTADKFTEFTESARTEKVIDLFGEEMKLGAT